MMIRNSAKAVVVRDGALLLQHCRHADGSEYYDLPGGGQNPFETMEETVVRECLEETGYAVAVERFLAICEEIVDDPVFRADHPESSHRILHIFLCRLLDTQQAAPTETDWDQVGADWVPLERLGEIPLLPATLAERLPSLLAANEIGYLGIDRLRRR